MGIKVVNGGLFTTIQDAGRMHFQDRGVPQSGFLDKRNAYLANILVGNNRDSAIIEMFMLGGEFIIEADTFIASTGAIADMLINGTRMKQHRAIKVYKGDRVSFGQFREGNILYLAVAGSFDIKEVMGSVSTYVRGKIAGDRLKSGDEIAFNKPTYELVNPSKRHYEFMPKNREVKEIDVVLGMQLEAFSEEEVARFLSSEYVITAEFDRMGCRLDGEAIKHISSANIISDAIVFGAIQIPDSGKPIVMLSDRQTIGGYTKIGAVASYAISDFVQSKIGQRIIFKEISLLDAQEKYRKQIEQIDKFEADINS